MKTQQLILLMGFSWWGYRMARKYALTDNNREIDLMARTIWGEARGEGNKGMQAVANVIMNRVSKGGWYGATVEDVVLKPYQFSCWNKDDPNYPLVKSVTLDNQQFKMAKEIAIKAYSGQLDDITGGSVNYHTSSIRPEWSKRLTKITQIGNHIFYT